MMPEEYAGAEKPPGVIEDNPSLPSLDSICEDTDDKPLVDRCLEYLAQKVDKKRLGTDSKYGGVHESPSIFRRAIGYAAMGCVFPTDIQEKYTEMAEIPSTRMTWYSIGACYAYKVAALAFVYGIGASTLTAIGLGALATVATASYLAFSIAYLCSNTARAIYVGVKKRPIANIPIELVHRLVVKQVSKKKAKISEKIKEKRSGPSLEDRAIHPEPEQKAGPGLTHSQ